jgi:hypothetical protein
MSRDFEGCSSGAKIDNNFVYEKFLLEKFAAMLFLFYICAD